MRTKLYGIIAVIIVASTLCYPMISINAANSGVIDDQTRAIYIVRTAISDSQRMVDKAIEVLSHGLSGMRIQERDLYVKYFDPGNTGEIDEDYVARTLANFHKIRVRLNGDIPLAFESNSSRCVMMTLYYTDFMRIHVCPYVLREVNYRRIARGVVHEVAHMVFLSWDRSYYYPNYSPYERLMPDVHLATHIPVIGYVIREILRSDTLYNADTYARFAAELLSQE